MLGRSRFPRRIKKTLKSIVLPPAHSESSRSVIRYPDSTKKRHSQSRRVQTAVQMKCNHSKTARARKPSSPGI